MQKMSVVIAGRNYLKEFYLQKARSTNNFFKKLTLLSNEVFITPDEMFELLLACQMICQRAMKYI